MNNKTLNIIIITLITTIIVVISGFTIFYFILIPKENTSGVGDTKTIMIYMVGSDLESENAIATAELLELERVKVDFEAVDILVYMGGSNNYYNEYIDAGENVILEYNENGINVVENIPAKNMGNPNTLEYFLDYTTTNYPSGNYSLILWNHGGGPLIGYGLDETTNDILTLAEIARALNNSNFNQDNKLGLLGFDACLMAGIESAYVLRDNAEFLVASQETEPGFGWDYSFLETITKESSNLEIGKSIIDYYYNFFIDNGFSQDCTLSLLDLSKVENVEKNLNDYFLNIEQNLTSQSFVEYAKNRVNTKAFGGFTTSSSYDLVDLNNMIDLLGGNNQELKKSLDEFIVYNKTNLSNSNGISIYYPYFNKTNAWQFLDIYKSFNFAPNYTQYLNDFVNILVGNRLVNLDISKSMPVESDEDLYDFEFILTDEQANNMVSAEYIVFHKIYNDLYEPVYRGNSGLVRDDNTLKANIRDKVIKVTETDDETQDITLYEVEKGSNYVNYFSPVMLSDFRDYVETGEFDMMSGYLQIRVYDDDTIEPLGIVPMETEDGIAPKMLTNLDDWHTLQFLKFNYKIFDENGNYDTNWESGGTIYGWELYIDEITGFAKADLQDSEYYCIFSIIDSQGNVSYSQAVPINN